MPTTRDYYEILSVEKTANGDEIKRAYRRLAMKHHPDRNPGDAEAEARFKECAEAYEVLADPQRRATYDRHGHAGLRGTAGHDFHSMNVDDIFSMFNEIFRGRGGSTGDRSRGGGRVPRGYDLETGVEITLEEVFTGTEREVEFKRLDVCQTCKGSGAKAGTKPTKCSTCGGVGQVIQTGLGGMFRMQATCPHCHGRGTVVTDKCSDCRGGGRVNIKRTIEVKLPAGLMDGQVVRVRGEGEPPPTEMSSAGEGIRGDLHVVVNVQDHEQFEREGDDLMYAAPIPFSQMALGAVTQVPTLDGIAEVKVPPGTQHNELFRVTGAGLPNLETGRRGDLIVIVQLVVPKKLNEQQKKLLAEYAQTESVEVGNGQPASAWQRLKRAVKGS